MDSETRQQTTGTLTFKKTIPIDNKDPLATIDTPEGIEATLKQRGNRYGSFDEHARITQNIKQAMYDSPNWGKLSADKKESLEMTAHKIGRILNGDPEYHDSWHDIVGYTKLVADTLHQDVG